MIDKLLTIAIGEIGYLEKASNSYLDDKTKNAGTANYTKYGRDMKNYVPGDTYGVNYQWCDQFVDWCFVKAFGLENAKKLLGGWSAYTPTSAGYFKTMKRYYSTPKRGDVVFFRNSERICHTGIVEKVEGSTVTTIEGNTSGASSLVSNGGGVKRKTYTIGTSYIDGFGRPDYDSIKTKIEIDDSKIGWYLDDIGWWYRFKEGKGKDTYYHGIVKEINGHCYAFNENGYLIMKTPTKIGIDENGALYVK